MNSNMGMGRDAGKRFENKTDGVGSLLNNPTRLFVVPAEPRAGVGRAVRGHVCL
jgi:hypothetical protein